MVGGSVPTQLLRNALRSATPNEKPARASSCRLFFTRAGAFGASLANRQELRTSYYPNGAVYVFRTALIRERRYYSDRSYAYVMPRSRSVDIDTLDDFDLAEFLMRRNRQMTS